MKFGSVCSGIEAASTAWHPLGWETAYVSDIEPFPNAVLAHRIGATAPKYRPDHIEAADWKRGLKGVVWGDRVPNYGDFTRIAEEADRPEIDLLVGGTPCQAFSVAGARQSLADRRGNLTLSFVDLVHATKSLRWVVWENVPGVLSTDDNAFGCFLSGLVGRDDPLHVPGGGRWPDAGMVCGPLGRAAWRILDAQHFGLAQRRRRVFLVFCPRTSRGDPVAVLFERKGVRGDSPARGEAGEGFAGGALPRAYGGGNRSGPVDVPACLVAGGNKQDFEVETFVAHTLRAEGFDASEAPIPFDTTQITSPGNRSRAEPGMPAGTLAKGAHAPAVAFALRGRETGAQPEMEGDQVGALRAASCGSSRSHVAFDTFNQSVGETSMTLRAGAGAEGVPATMTASAVRRLTPRECERLQGFPDDHTAIVWKGKEAPDGPRYKALGNSMAVPVMRWIGERIAAYEAGTLDSWRFMTTAPKAGVGSAIPILEAGARTGKSTTDPRAGMGIGSDGDPMFTLQAGKQHAVAQ